MEFPENLKENKNRVPGWLKILYLLVSLWCVWYFISHIKEHGTAAFPAAMEE